MTTFSEIPTQASPQSIRFQIGSTTYRSTIKWNDDPSMQCWVIDLYDDLLDPVITGVPMVTGCDLLGQYAYLAIAAQIFAQTDNDADAVPTFDNLGTNGHLYVATQP